MKKAVLCSTLLLMGLAVMLAAASPAKGAPSPEESQDPAGGTEALGDAASPPQTPSPGETGRMVALTFDDGPHKDYTEQLLDILERYDARATFFEVGKNLEISPDSLKREPALGCEVASHSYSHPKFSKISGEEALADMEASDASFLEALGYVPPLLRPPYGRWSDALNGTKYAAVTWSVDTADWQCRDAKEIVSSVQGLEELDGQVILMHSLYKSTVEAVEVLVPWLQEQGYELVTVSELLERRFGETPEAGRFYDAHFFWSVLPREPKNYSNYKAS